MTRTPDGGLARGSGPGRGAWLCPDVACVAAARRRRAFGRALRGEVRSEAVDDLAVAFAG